MLVRPVSRKRIRVMLVEHVVLPSFIQLKKAAPSPGGVQGSENSFFFSR